MRDYVIMTDSCCDLTAEEITELGLTVLPLTYTLDGVNHKNDVFHPEMSNQEFFQKIREGADCSTSAVSVGEYQEHFTKYAGEYDGVIHICISSDFSSTYRHACIAAEDFENVRVVDSRNLSTGQGLVVLKACELAKTAASLDELKRELDDFTSRVEASFLVDRLDYLVRGGRCSSAAALGANLLNLKPCIEVKDGKMGVAKKYRGKYAKCLANYVKDRLDGRDDLDDGILFITHTGVSEECHEAVVEAVSTYGHFHKVYETLAGCTVSCHCGPGTLGILFVRKK